MSIPSNASNISPGVNFGHKLELGNKQDAIKAAFADRVWENAFGDHPIKTA